MYYLNLDSTTVFENYFFKSVALKMFLKSENFGLFFSHCDIMEMQKVAFFFSYH